MSSPVVVVQCDDCRRELVTVHTDGGVTVLDDVSEIFITGVAYWPTVYPEFECPQHGGREPFDLLGYHAELRRADSTFAVTV